MGFFAAIGNFFKKLFGELVDPTPVILPPATPPKPDPVVPAPVVPVPPVVITTPPPTVPHNVQIVPDSTDYNVLGPVLENNYWACSLTSHSGDVYNDGPVALKNQARYEAVQAKTGVPWIVVAAIHMRESGFDFNGGLANGDPLNKKTVNVPAGRGPFATWEDSAYDALAYDGLSGKPAGFWNVGQMLYQCFKYNGFGYITSSHASQTVPLRTSPYIWAGTTAYLSGKYVADGVFSSTSVDKQTGVAALFKYLEAKGVKIS